MPAAHYRINSPPVVLETVDEETIIVNLDTGSYYDLNHTGGRLLEALGRGHSLDAAIDLLASDYSVDREQVAATIGALVGQLESEGIVVEAGAEPSAAGAVNGWEPPVKPFEAPALSKYTDMQELLLLDPVHEVDGAGWPNKV